MALTLAIRPDDRHGGENRLLMVAHTRSFVPPIRKIREVISSGGWAGYPRTRSLLAWLPYAEPVK
jgi:predicted dehydrogenase